MEEGGVNQERPLGGGGMQTEACAVEGGSHTQIWGRTSNEEALKQERGQ